MLISPRKTPRDFGLTPKDSHIVVSAPAKRAKIYKGDGQLLWDIPCLAEGQNPDWKITGGDTPPGLYKIGTTYNDWARVGKDPGYDRTLMQYGWISYDLIDLEGNEDDNNRAGVMLHGGGSLCGWPGAWAPRQVLYPTLGCLRAHNEDLLSKILPLTKWGTVFVSVHQDDK